MYGEYTSINDLPEFADYIAEHGPADPDIKVTLIKNAEGHYTIGGIPELYQDENDVWQTGLWFDMSVFDTLDPEHGVSVTSNGQFSMDFEGSRYIIYTSAITGKTILYSCNYLIPDPWFMINMHQIMIPSDHPLIGTMRQVVKPVEPE